jgi:hypothetical protein
MAPCHNCSATGKSHGPSTGAAASLRIGANHRSDQGFGAKDAVNIRPHPIAAPINTISVTGITTSAISNNNAGPVGRFQP